MLAIDVGYVIRKVNNSITDMEIAICQKVFDELRSCEGFVHSKAFNIAIAMGQFAIIFREDNGIQAMLDFITWCKENHEEYAILGTCMHDINGRHEKFMSPRTSSYLKEHSNETES